MVARDMVGNGRNIVIFQCGLEPHVTRLQRTPHRWRLELSALKRVCWGDACLKTTKGGAPSSLVREKKKEKEEEEEREMGHEGGKRGGERVF